MEAVNNCTGRWTAHSARTVLMG